MSLHAATLAIELHVPHSRSLKAKRAVIKPIVEGLRLRFAVAAAEVGHLDQWQRSALGVSAVGSTAAHVTDVLDAAERFVWSNPEVDVLSSERLWVDGG